MIFPRVRGVPRLNEYGTTRISLLLSGTNKGKRPLVSTDLDFCDGFESKLTKVIPCCTEKVYYGIITLIDANLDPSDDQMLQNHKQKRWSPGIHPVILTLDQIWALMGREKTFYFVQKLTPLRIIKDLGKVLLFGSLD